MSERVESKPNTPRGALAAVLPIAALAMCVGGVWWAWGRFVGGAAASEARLVTSARAPVEVVNRLCPVYKDQPIARRVDPALVVEWRGRKIGLCCDECILEWNAWEDARKDVFVDEWSSPAPMEDW